MLVCYSRNFQADGHPTVSISSDAQEVNLPTPASTMTMPQYTLRKGLLKAMTLEATNFMKYEMTNFNDECSVRLINGASWQEWGQCSKTAIIIRSSPN